MCLKPHDLLRFVLFCFVADVFWTHLNLHFSFYGATAEDGLCMDWILIRNTQLVFLHIYFDMYPPPPPLWVFLFCWPVFLFTKLFRHSQLDGFWDCVSAELQMWTNNAVVVCQWELVMVSRLITLSFLHNEWIIWPTHQSVSQTISVDDWFANNDKYFT